jgi:hypothetical protein
MDAPVQEKVVLTGPGLSTAAQVATNVAANLNAQLPDVIATIKPVDVVDRNFVESIGIETTGWITNGKLFWKQHSVQFWTAAGVTETGLQILQTWIPQDWKDLGHWVAIGLMGLGMLFKARRQAGLIVDRIREEVRGHTE